MPSPESPGTSSPSSAPPLDARASAAVADRYRIERVLGRGGMATVYAAEDLKHGRRVAIKVVDPAISIALGHVRFLREVRVAASLQHPNILPLFDSGEAGDLQRDRCAPASAARAGSRDPRRGLRGHDVDASHRSGELLGGSPRLADRRQRAAHRSAHGEDFEIIGVVEDVKQSGLDMPASPEAYTSYADSRIDWNGGDMSIVVKTAVPELSIVAPLRQAVKDVARDVALLDVRPMNEVIDRSLSKRKVTLALFGIFARCRARARHVRFVRRHLLSGDATNP